ncbi:unnamed protein product [Clonostachys rosea]|uniref:Up-regulated during septation protein 1 domain-containing protein n=1 Tax=Bionectria ochroleuca TaxID=29856 RepID=A0ABY6TYQ5_BIOOC|nr:unnamed protein product [Clonostachys rosea]
MDAVGDNVPLALRRSRRSNFGVRIKSEPDAVPEAKTPRRSSSKRRVRFSDSAATGLTPMVRRTVLTTPTSTRRRRVSAPAATPSSSTNRVTDLSSRDGPDTPSLHHVIDGRVDRHQRRSALRTALEKLDFTHRRSNQQAKSQIAQLRDELRVRDREIYELQNATIVVNNDRLWELEQQVDDLQAELREARSRQDLRESSPMDWTFGAPPSNHQRSRGFDADDEDQFGDATMAQLVCSTPSRVRSSFPTPPATSPPAYGPGTPTMGYFNRPDRALTPELQPELPTTTTAGVQTSLPDPTAEAEMESMQREARKLSETLDSHLSLLERISRRLPRDSTVTDGDDTVVVWGPETVEKQVDAVMRTLSDRAAALTSLTTTISALGYPGNDASEMLTSLATSFRAARLELEYLTPGEITLPLTSRSAEVLDLLLVRLRELARKVKEGDDAIDEYHAIELSLRKQLDSRVSVMDDLKADLANKEGLVADKIANIKELEVANDRLKGAVEGYLRDISQLEQLVEKMERESTTKSSTIAERDASISELEGKLQAASRRASDLQDELEVVQASRKKHLDSINRRSGEALALRDARVKELRDEVDRVNSSLRSAHETICRLRADNGYVERENQSLREAVEGMKGELQKVMKRSEEILAASSGTGEATSSPTEYRSGNLARRLGSSKRRRPDSGLGFMEGDEVNF